MSDLMAGLVARRKALARWRAEKPEEREFEIADHADLCVWLLEKLEAAENRKSAYSMVRDFMLSTDQPVLLSPGEPLLIRTMRLRAELIIEEAFEFVCATGVATPEMTRAFDAIRDGVRTMTVQPSLPAIADALADLTYVVNGGWLTYGITPRPVFEEVHRTNMAKVGGPVDPVTNKRLKPEGWKPPDVAGVLRAQGWKG